MELENHQTAWPTAAHRQNGQLSEHAGWMRVRTIVCVVVAGVSEHDSVYSVVFYSSFFLSNFFLFFSFYFILFFLTFLFFSNFFIFLDLLLFFLTFNQIFYVLSDDLTVDLDRYLSLSTNMIDRIANLGALSKQWVSFVPKLLSERGTFSFLNVQKSVFGPTRLSFEIIFWRGSRYLPLVCFSCGRSKTTPPYAEKVQWDSAVQFGWNIFHQNALGSLGQHFVQNARWPLVV